MISRPAISIRRFYCKGAKTDSCLAPKQVTALKELMGGPHDSKGQQLYAAFPYDTGISGHGLPT